MYTAILFDHACPHEQLRAFIKTRILPSLAQQGCRARFLCNEVSLSPREYWLVLDEYIADEKDKLPHIFGGDLYGAFQAAAQNMLKWRLRDLEPEIPWFRADGKLYHMESFSRVVPEEVFEGFFLASSCPTGAKGVFMPSFFVGRTTAKSLYWLMTELDSIGSIETWPEKATGEYEGQRLMQRLISYQDFPRGNVIREII